MKVRIVGFREPSRPWFDTEARARYAPTCYSKECWIAHAVRGIALQGKDGAGRAVVYGCERERLMLWGIRVDGDSHLFQ
jgi:hypothetical protein